MVLKEVKTVFCTGLVALSFVVFFFCQYAFCAEAVIFKDGLLSVNLEDSSLLDVAIDIEKHSGVWFRGDETQFQEKISVTFNDLPLEEGLKRILTNLNYSLIFDTKNNVAGVMVMGEGTPAGTQPGRPVAQPSRVATPPGASTRPTPTVRRRPSTSFPPSARIRQLPRAVPRRVQGAPATQVLESDGPLPPAFRIMENAPPPGGPVAGKETPEGTKGITGAPGPGGTGEGTEVKSRGSTPAKDVPSAEEGSKSDTTP